MSTPNILAHGTLGNWDEVIFLTVAAVFLVMMGVSWLKSRNITPEVDETEPAEADASHFPME